MYRNDCIVRRPAAAESEFSFREICGRWRSPDGSPDLRIYFTGKRNFRVEFTYGPGVVFRRPIRRLWRKAYFLLYGRIELSYNPHRDVLTLSDYGEYVRSED